MSTGASRLTRVVPRSGPVLIGSGSAAAQLLALAASPWLTRLFTPSAFGVLALFTSVSAVIAVLGSLRLEQAVPSAATDELAQSIGWIVRVLAIGVGVLTGAVGWAIANSSVTASLAPGFRQVLWMLGPTVLLMAWYELDAARLIRAESHRRLGARAFVQGAGQVAVQLVGGMLAFGANALVVGFGLGRGLAQVIRVPGSWGPFPSVTRLRAALSAERRFPTMLAPAALLNLTALGLPVVILTAVFSDAVAGQFALTQRIIGTPVALISLAVGQVYFGAMARLLRESPARALGYFNGWLRKLAVYCGVPIVLGSIAAIWIFPLLFGSQWSEAGLFAAVMAPAAFAQVTVSPLSATLIVTRRLGQQLAWDAGRVVLLIAAGVVASRMALSPVTTLVLITAIWCVTYAWLAWRCSAVLREAQGQ